MTAPRRDAEYAYVFPDQSLDTDTTYFAGARMRADYNYNARTRTKIISAGI